MTSDQLALIHAAAFVQDRSWSAAEFDDLLTSDLVRLYARSGGFALTRLVAGEAELLTFAVAPAHQNRGIGRALLNQWLGDIAGRADSAFLEVAADNAPARHLYQSCGFTLAARRRGYYLRKDTAAADALIFRADLTNGQPAE